MNILDYSPMPKTLVSIIPKGFHGEVSEQLLISDVQADSRDVTPGSLFIALCGLDGDGEKYISNAVENGAVAILVEEDHLCSVLNVEVPVVGIKNLKENIPSITEKFYNSPVDDLSVFGVTGTNGKSTITSLIAQLHALLGIKAGVLGTLGYGMVNDEYIDTGMTTPDLVKCQRIFAEIVACKGKVIAMEVSSHGIHQRRVENINFDIAVLSNITHDHLDYHGTFENYANVKRSFLLSDNCKSCVVNADDEDCRKVIPELQDLDKNYVTFGIDAEDAMVKAEIKKYTPSSIDAQILSPWGKADICCPLVGKFNLSNLLAAIASLCSSGVKFNKVIRAINKLKPVEGRLQKVDSPAEGLPSVFVDYAHTPDALKQALMALRNHVSGNLWVVFGCGGDRDPSKRAIMGEIAATFADSVVITSDNPRTEDPKAIIKDIVQGVASDTAYEVITERELAISLAIGNCSANDCVLIAGKGHENYQLIGHTKVPFYDYHIAEVALRQRAQSTKVMP